MRPLLQLFLPVTLAAAFVALQTNPAAATPPNIPSASTAASRLASLTVAAESHHSSYDRALFPHWITISGACNTRETVLKRDGTGVVTSSSCAAVSGSWYSPFDGATWQAAADVDIDHMVSAPATEDRRVSAGQIVGGMSVTVVRDPWQHLRELRVSARGSKTGYSREKYPHWIDQGSNCDTREVVLQRDGRNVQTGTDCAPVSGTWTSRYDGATWTQPSDIDIDHVVPLAQSWVSGASSWTTEKRKQFANDLTRPQLLAVTDDVNQGKSDKAPDEWKPPLRSYWCTYATNWITVKHYYTLTITSAEKTALSHMLDRC